MSCFSVEILDTNTKVLEIETCVGNEPGNIEIINYDTNNIIIEQCPIVLPSEFSSMADAEIASFIKSGSGINLNASVTGLTISVSGLNTTYLSNFNTAVSELIPVKNIIASSGISVVNNSGSYTVAVTGQFGLTGEQVDDRVAGLLVAGNGIGLNYNDIGDNLTISSTLTSILEAQSLVTTVFNRSQTPIPKMTVVYINGGQGDMPTVAYSIASGESSSSKTYGVTQEIIPAMGSGHVVVDGYIGGLNTDQFNPTAPQGDVNGVTLWLSPTVSGAMTTSKPYAPYHMVAVGKIIRTHQNQGIISVKIQNGYELEELHNVATTGATNGQFLQYNSSNSLWIPSSSGNFTLLKVNNLDVSVSGHSHVSNDITDFNSAVSGLLPITNLSAGSGIGITQSGTTFTVATTGTFGLTQAQVDARVNTLTSGIYAPLSGATFTGSISGPSGNFTSLKVDNVDVSGLLTSNSGNFTGNLTVGGNLTVNGTTAIVNVETVTIEDPIITLGLASGNVVPFTNFDRGLALIRATGLTAFMGWDTSASQFVMLSSGIASNSSGNYDAGTYGNLQINNLSSSRVYSSRLDLNDGINNSFISCGAEGDTRFLVSSSGELGIGSAIPSTIDSAPFYISPNGSVTNGTWNASTIAVNKGGTGRTTYSNGQLLIGSGTSLVANTLTATSGIGITNGSGTITIGVTGIPSSTITNFNSSVSGLLTPYQLALTNPVTGVGTSGYLTKWISSSGVGSGVIFDNGSGIGIGTTNPLSTLDVRGELRASGLSGTQTTIWLSDNNIPAYKSIIHHGNFIQFNQNNVVAGYGVGIRLNNPSNVGIDSNGPNGYLALAAGGSEKVRIATDGKVGVGITSPLDLIHVSGTSTGAQGIRLENADGYGGSIQADNGALYLSSPTATVCRLQASKIRMGDGVSSTAIELTSNGSISQDGNGGGLTFSGTTARFSNGVNVTGSGTFTSIGVGTSTPSGQLHVIGTGLFSTKLGVGISGFPTWVSIGGTPHTFVHIYGQSGLFPDVNERAFGSLLRLNSEASTTNPRIDFRIGGPGNYDNHFFISRNGTDVIGVDDVNKMFLPNGFTILNPTNNGEGTNASIRSYNDPSSFMTFDNNTRSMIIGYRGKGANDQYIDVASSGRLKIYNYYSEVATFDNRGRFGIGTSTPSGQLHVIGTGLFSNSIGINTNSNSVGATSYALLVDGDVSVGSGNATRTLSVWGNNTNKRLLLKNVNGNSFISYVFGSQDLNLGGPQPTDYPFNNINYYAGSTSAGMHRFHVSVDGTGLPPAMVIANSGVGIGTTSPISPLHVVGSGRFVGSNGNTIIINATNENGAVSIDAPSSLYSDISLRVNSQNIFRGLDGWTATWADSAATTYFQVGRAAGNTIFTSLVGNAFNRLAYSSNKYLFTNQTTNITVPSNYFNIEYNGTSILSATTGGSVGIGTTTPSGQLHVIGSGIFSNGIISNSGYLSYLNINNNTVAGSYALAVNGTITTQGQDAIAGGFSIYGSTLNKLILTNSTLRLSTNDISVPHTFVHFSGATPIERMRITGSGVGIGTSTPSGQLHVIGAGLFSNGIGINTTSPSGFFDIKGDMYVRSSGVNGGFGKIYFPATNFGTDNSIWMGLDGNQNLTLLGGGPTLTLSPNGGNALLRSGSTNIEIGQSYNAGTNNQFIRFVPAGTEAVRITSSGNVGIGTSTPSGQLHVVGDTYIDNSFKLYVVASGASKTRNYIWSPSNGSLEIIAGGPRVLLSPDGGTVDIGGTVSQSINIGHGYLNAGANNQHLRFTPGGTELMRITNSGTMGIGLPTTNNLFNQQPYTNTRVHIAGSGADSGSAALIVTNSGISPLLYVRNDGNIGIGTISPSSKLDVNGNVNIDGNLTFDSFTESVISNGNSSSGVILSLTSGTVHTCTLTNNCTFTMPTATAGKSFTMFLNTGSGNYTAAFSGVRWADSATPTATILANKIDIYSFISDGSYWYGSFSQNYG